MVKYDFIYTIFTLAAVDVCASTMKSKAGKPEKGVYLSAKGGDNGEVSFGSESNTLKVDGSTAVAIIRVGTLDASNSEDYGLVVNNDGSAYVCKADLIRGGTSNFGDGLPGVLLSDPQASGSLNSVIPIVNARIEGGNAGPATPSNQNPVEGAGLKLNRGQADIVSEKSSIVGGLNYDGTSRGIAIDNSANLYVYEGHIGDAMTITSLNNFGYAYIYGGKWMGRWSIPGGTTNVYGNLVHDNDKLTGTLCDGNEIDVQIFCPYGAQFCSLNLDQNCDGYENYVTNTLPYTECE
jgi:hypothetical protein